MAPRGCAIMAKRQLPLPQISNLCKDGNHTMRGYVAFFALRKMHIEIRYCRKCGYEEEYREVKDERA